MLSNLRFIRQCSVITVDAGGVFGPYRDTTLTLITSTLLGHKSSCELHSVNEMTSAQLLA